MAVSGEASDPESKGEESLDSLPLGCGLSRSTYSPFSGCNKDAGAHGASSDVQGAGWHNGVHRDCYQPYLDPHMAGEGESLHGRLFM